MQTAEKALNSPAVGCVTTTFSLVKTVPPPTGIPEVLVSGGAPVAVAEVAGSSGVADAADVAGALGAAEVSGVAGAVVSVPPSPPPSEPQPAVRAAAAIRTVRRFVAREVMVPSLAAPLPEVPQHAYGRGVSSLARPSASRRTSRTSRTAVRSIAP
ncbi:hypothetical protein SGA01_34090 [Streptomyces gardneri]|uniref:Uncharacterized protein n=1 Tax=Streptomyces gardneri TaxID=66892 RepID=A0A4Y3RKC2_9ACTN|nr:hypothetical protein SGA01_34090 [Streptomyces gardneri]